MTANVEEFLLQWNTSSLISHWAEFREYIANKKPLLAAVQETHFLDSDLHNYQLTPFGYSLYCNNVNDSPRRGGSALYVSNSILHHQVFFDSPLSHVAVNIKIAQREITILSIYLSPCHPISAGQMDHLFNQIPSPCLLLGDFNARHTAWGCHTHNTRGHMLHTLLDKHNLVFLNNTTPTHHSMRQGQISYSVIDLALASPQIATLFTSHVQSDPLFSDHYPIHLNLEVPSGQTNFNFFPRWNLRKADWISFQNHIDEHSYNCNPDLPTFLNIILASAHEYIPHTRPPQGRNHSPWWNNECQRAVALRRRALRQFKRCICADHEAAAREARSQSRQIILKAKKDGWENFSNKFNRFTPLSKIWTMIKCFTNKRSPTFKIPHLIINNQHYSTPLEVATQFAIHYSRISSHNQYTEHLHTTLNATLTTCHFQSTNTEHYNHLFTINELQLALSKCGNTSVGPDQLAYQFFKNLTESGLVNLLSGLNQLWVDGTFPDTWSTSTLIPILKPRKPQSDPASYRPISLSSCACKIFERMVNGRLRTYLESNNLLSPYQNGFRPGRSTADSLVHLIDSAQRAFQSKEVTVTLFLDLKSAFDKVHHSALLIKLHKIGIRGRLATFVKNFLKNRSFSVRCGNTYSTSVEQQHGVPQGSVISPTLFLIAIDDVFNNIHNISNQFKYSIYADDIAVWFSHWSVDRANCFIQLALNHINDRCLKSGLQISPAKSASLIFSKQRSHLHPLTPLTLNGEPIPVVETFKYLGLTLDRRLTFTPHFNDLIQRCSRRLNILKCIAGREWGADRCTLLHLYTSLIRPILDYNAFLFDGISSSHISRLEAIQNSALRIATGALRTTPTVNLNTDTNIPPLARRRSYLLLRFYARAVSRPTHPTYHTLSHLPTNRTLTAAQTRNPTISIRIKRALEHFHITLPPISPVPSLTPFWTHRPIYISLLFSSPKSNIAPIDINTMFLEYKDRHQDFSFIYTDGSRANGRSGAAFAINDFVQSYRLSDHHSILSAELAAILSAIRHIQFRAIDKAVICSDSRSALQLLSSTHNLSHPTVYQIRDLMLSLPNNYTITFLWIPGHAGIPGNETADRAAKASLNDSSRDHLPCSVSDFLHSIHSSFLSSLQRDWDQTQHYHLYPIKPILGHWPSSHQHTRLKEILIARLRLGHTKITHLYIINHEPHPICNTCQTNYTISHMLINCQQYATERQPIIRYAAANRLPLTLRVILGDSHPDLLSLLFDFLHNTRLELAI